MQTVFLGFYNKILRIIKFIITTIALTVSKPRANQCVITTANSYEENAAVQVLRLIKSNHKKIIILSPDSAASLKTLYVCSRILNIEVIQGELIFKKNSYWNTLKSYMISEKTFTTHVILPGADFSKKRNHSLLTHGSGDKKEICFRSPLNTLYSITPLFEKQQLVEYKFRKKAQVLHDQPRLEIFRELSSQGKNRLMGKLRLDETKKLVVWAPTYRNAKKNKHSQRSTGINFDSIVVANLVNDTIEKIHEAGYEFIIKVHTADLTSYSLLNARKITSEELISLGIATYQLFGHADLIMTDHSSIKYERILNNMDCLCWCPDLREFENNYRGLRDGWDGIPAVEDIELVIEYFNKEKQNRNFE